MKIKKMIPLIDRCIMNTITVLDDLASNKSEIDLRKTLKAFALDVIAECAFAVSTNGHVNPENEFLRQLGNCLNFSSWRLILANILPPSIQKRIGFQMYPKDAISYFSNAIKHVLTETRSNEASFDSIDEFEAETEIIDKNQKAFKISTKCKNYLDESEVLAQCITLLLAGYETTSTLLYYCVYLLALNPEKQAILHKE
ncbi:cytochrome P450 3A40-like protein, partial [Leptotrombidium deliense]